MNHLDEIRAKRNIEDIVSGEKDLDELTPTGGSFLFTPRRTWLARLLDPASSALAQGSTTQPKEITKKLKEAIEGELNGMAVMMSEGTGKDNDKEVRVLLVAFEVDDDHRAAMVFVGAAAVTKTYKQAIKDMTGKKPLAMLMR
ncbi:MAG: hypothetical protein IH793_07995 [Acidobacteria bacterium]|nr:hypothetical protein [Acidobacteriota bacterium]